MKYYNVWQWNDDIDIINEMVMIIIYCENNINVIVIMTILMCNDTMTNINNVK